MNPYFTKGIIQNKEEIASKETGEISLLIITVKLVNPEVKPFRPGQFCTFRVAEGIFRSYSISSDYKNFSEYQFIISVAHEGIGSNYFKQIAIGDEVDFLGPSGHFKIEAPVSENIIFCATGTGIAPFIPMIEFLLDNNCSSKIALIHGMKTEANLSYYQSIHQDLKNRCENFINKIYVSQPLKNSNEFIKGRITDEIKAMDLSKHNKTQFYLCGHPDMVSEVSEFLITSGIKEENVISEIFTSPGFYQREK
jgi:ferredoxin-NADP reductase